MKLKSCLILLPIFILSCKAGENESNGPVFCSINQTATYQLTTDPGVDFNDTNLQKDTTFNTNTCPDVNTESFSILISRVKRVGTAVTIIENEFSGGQFTLALVASGTSLLPLENKLTFNGCTVIRRWIGTIVSPGTTITVTKNTTYKGACESTFLDQESTSLEYFF